MPPPTSSAAFTAATIPGELAAPARAVHSASADSSRLRVHFVPRWPRNPYHTELARHLDRCDVDVADESQLKSILAEFRRTGRRPDVIHLHALPPVALQPAKLARLLVFWFRLHRLQRSGVKIVWTVHNAADHESAHPRLDRFLSRRCYHLADAVIIHSLGARDAIETQWRTVRRHNSFIVHHGHFLDCYPAGIPRTDARAQLGLPADAVVFLFLGNIRPYKGVQQLVRDFKAIATPNLRLVIAGETLSPELRDDIQREIGICDRIDFRPHFVPDAEVQTYLAASDVVVFPYTKALTSGALILAMGFGRACIAPRVGAITDTLPTAGGFLFDPDEPASLRHALSRALLAAPQLSAMGATNARCAQSWGWAEAARLTASAYRTCFQ